MANYRNEYEFRSGLLDALGVEHTEADAKNEERWRAKMLDGLEVEYNQNDVNQFDLFRAKLVEGVEAKAEGGGGGSSDFSTAEVTINAPESFELTWQSCPMLLNDYLSGDLYVEGIPATITVPLYKGKCYWGHPALGLTLSGNIEEYYDGMLITGDCTITIS